jgi:cytochrome b involved in lipid metabolism
MAMNRKVIAFLATAFLLIFLMVVFSVVRNGQKEGELSSTKEQTDSRIALYPASEVAQHASKESCWAIVRGGIYDLTSWINQHPGGRQAILGLCGKDGTAAFESTHGGQEGPEKVLKEFKIGELGVN